MCTRRRCYQNHAHFEPCFNGVGRPVTFPYPFSFIRPYQIQSVGYTLYRRPRVFAVVYCVQQLAPYALIPLLGLFPLLLLAPRVNLVITSATPSPQSSKILLNIYPLQSRSLTPLRRAGALPNYSAGPPLVVHLSSFALERLITTVG